MRVLVGLMMATAFGWPRGGRASNRSIPFGAKGVIRKKNRPIVYWAAVAYGIFMSLTHIAGALYASYLAAFIASAAAEKRRRANQ